MTINENLFLILEEKKLKQSELAKHLDVSQAVITTWKTRKTDPPANKLINICKFLDISIYELLGAENENQSELDKLYAKASAKDKSYIDFILSQYKDQEQTSSTSKIG